MSAFAVIFERSNTPVQTGVLESVLSRLQHRGPDGLDTAVSDNVAMGHWHFWTTPEESGERQPLKLDGLPFIIVMDGRLDNRTDLLNRLGVDVEIGHRLSDAAILLQAYARWGTECFAGLLGEFAFVIYDERQREVVCARDVLGDRTLFYALHGSRVILASEAWAVAAVDPAGTRLSERAVAHYFAMEMPQDGQSLFEGVFELLPAHALRISLAGEHAWRYWQPNIPGRNRKRTDQDYADEFRSLLEEAVRCRLRSITPPAVMMSGGLDSTSVACLAARLTALQPLTTLSYVFDELMECDEREYIQAVVERYGMKSIQVAGDGAWPLRDIQNWSFNPNYPQGNPYRLLPELIYRTANQNGMRVLLTGMYGDELYSGEEEILVDLLADGRLRVAAREFYHLVRNNGVSGAVKSWPVRRVVRRTLDAIPGGKRLRLKEVSPAWLRAYAVEKGGFPVTIDKSHREELILGLWTTSSNSYEISNTSRYDVELRNPYRDRRLIEFCLGLPAYQTTRYGETKFILRTAMRGILPETVRTRAGYTIFLPLLNRGIEREQTILQACMMDPQAKWRKYVHPEYVEPVWNVPASAEEDGPKSVLPWICYFYELWYKMLGFDAN